VARQVWCRKECFFCTGKLWRGRFGAGKSVFLHRGVVARQIWCRKECFFAPEVVARQVWCRKECFSAPEIVVRQVWCRKECFSALEVVARQVWCRKECFFALGSCGGVSFGHKKRVSLIYRTATTAYPCCLPALGEFCRSWSYMTYPGTKVRKFINFPNEKYTGGLFWWATRSVLNSLLFPGEIAERERQQCIH